MAAISFIKNLQVSERSKHIEIDVYHTKKQMRNNAIFFEETPSKLARGSYIN